MKVCVFSDSHGYAGNMIDAIKLEDPDLCFFLGDGERDIVKVGERFPDLPIYAVRGNCDFRSNLSRSLCCAVGGVTLFATHGHLSDVKYEDKLDTLTEQALRAGASVALFGHTHRQHLSENQGVTLVNPGPAGRGYYPGYAVLTIEDGKCRAELKAI
jgi:hypothetical protein